MVDDGYSGGGPSDVEIGGSVLADYLGLMLS
jgi:hypothetical protein